jgi:valyl-tRNA synthetase
VGAERALLERERGRAEGEAEKIRRKLLGNVDFVRRAPAEVVEETRERLAAAEGEVERLGEALGRLG